MSKLSMGDVKAQRTPQNSENTENKTGKNRKCNNSKRPKPRKK